MHAPGSAVVTIKVPFAVRKRGGRKLVLAPDGAPVPPLAPHVDTTLVKAIGRAFRWQKMLEAGRYATIKEIAKAERINASYVSRVLRLTLLAPATVEAILAGRPSEELTAVGAMKPFPVVWLDQQDWTIAMRGPFPAQVGRSSVAADRRICRTRQAP
jgi:hypothetical protein